MFLQESLILNNNYSLIDIHIGYDRDKKNKDNGKNVGVLIKDILNDIKKNSCVNINRIKKAERIKVVLLGESSASKTKFLRQICLPKYASFSQNLHSIFSSYSTKIFDYPELEKSIKFEIWDTASQERYIDQWLKCIIKILMLLYLFIV